MTQLPDEVLKQAQEYIRTGKLPAAQAVLVEYLKRNPGSAQAWWLMSLAVTDANQQMDCLQRVLRLDPLNVPARERLSKLKAGSGGEAAPVFKPPVESPASTPVSNLPPASSFRPAAPPSTPPTPSVPAFTEEPLIEKPAWAFEKETSSPAQVPPAGADSAGPEEPKKRDGFLRKAGLVALAEVALLLVAYFVYGWFQQVQQTRSLNAQATKQAEQLLTSVPVQVPSSTTTPSPTWTMTASLTSSMTLTLTPALQLTPSSTPTLAKLVGPYIGQFAPGFTLVDAASGKDVSLSQFEGKPVVIVFMTTWCTYCDADLLYLDVVYRDHQDAGLVVLGIDVGEATDVVRTYRNNMKLTFPLLLDTDGGTREAYQVTAYPWHFFLRPAGSIAYVQRGQMNQDDLERQVAAIMRVFPTATP